MMDQMKESAMDFQPGQPVLYRDPEHPVTRDPLGFVRGREHGMYAVDMEDGRELMVDGSVLVPVSHAEAAQHREAREKTLAEAERLRQLDAVHQRESQELEARHARQNAVRRAQRGE